MKKTNIISFLDELFVIFKQEDTLRKAAALTFATLLSLIPILATAMAILSIFYGVNDIQDLLHDTMSSFFLPQALSHISDYMSLFLSNTMQMTVFGVASLLITSLLLMATIESSFNRIWHVSTQRPILTRILAFWAVLTLSPVFIAISIAFSERILLGFTKLGLHQGTILLAFLNHFVPFVIQALGFALLYMVVPHRKIEFPHAAIGGVFSSLLFQVSKSLFSWYAGAFPIYQSIYGAVSTIPLFLIWLYIVWIVVLYGAMITAHLPNFKFYVGGRVYSDPRRAELLAVMLMILQTISEGCRKNRLVQESELRAKIGIESYIFDEAINRLHEKNIIMPSKGQVWVISYDIANLTIFDICRLAGFDLEPSLNMIKNVGAPVLKDLKDLLESSQNRLQTNLSKPLNEIF